MKSLAAAALSLSLLTAESEGAQPMNVVITPVGSQQSAVGPAEYFTGKVRVDAPFKGTDGARIGGATVTFEPGARTAWHTHPLGQTLMFSRKGRRHNAFVRVIRSGFPPMSSIGTVPRRVPA
jgi:hypothetical protein